jgi:hypothetical protein
MLFGERGVMMSGCQFWSCTIPALAKLSAFWMTVIGRQALSVYFVFQAVTAA